MWPSLATVPKLNKPNPTTSSTSVTIYPPIQVPSDGRPVPSNATTQRRRAGCRTQSRPERGEDDRFWKPHNSRKSESKNSINLRVVQFYVKSTKPRSRCYAP
jgi:hypothetical protein